jgi:hypothetical protein
MPELVTTTDDAVLARHRFLRGGAVLAAAAGGAVPAAATATQPATTADTPPPYAVAIRPELVLDTRTSEGRSAIVASSTSALDAQHRLRKGAWIDVAVAPTDDDLLLVSVFVNLTSSGSTRAGSLVVTEPGDKPTGTTLTFARGRTVTNSAIVGVRNRADVYTVRIFAMGTGHVSLDVTGASLAFGTQPEEPLLRTSRRPDAQRLLEAVRTARTVRG